MPRRRHKKRTHVAETEEDLAKVPRSMILKVGDNKREVTHSLASLVRDFRLMMNPHTAARLRERKGNKLKDFVVMAGPLGVSHFVLFSQSLQGNTTMRMARTPRGPTLYFNVKAYSLCKDVRAAVRNPRSVGRAGSSSSDYVNPPLLVMNGFSSNTKTSDKDALLTTMFQNMFPPISVQSTKVGSIKRVMMVNLDQETGLIDIRHYAIDTKLVGVSKPVKKLNTVKSRLHRNLPNMSRASDIADYLLDPAAGGYTSESEVEDDATVEVAAESTAAEEKREEVSTQKRAIKLVEIGPRLRLELRKIEEGLCSGKTLYHSFVEKSKDEAKKLEKTHATRQSLKEQRRKEQEENVRRKQEAKVKSSRTKRGLEKAAEKTDMEVDDAEGEVDEDADEDAEADAEDDDEIVDPEDMDDYELELAAAEEDDEDEEEDDDE